MGGTTSLEAVAASTEMLHYIDLEGGVRNKPVWDVALVAATSGEAVRWFCMTNDRARKMLLRSVPESWRVKISQHGDKVQRVKYDRQCNILEHEVCNGTVADELGAFLRERRYSGGTVLAAWGMDTHDAKVLHRLLGKEQFGPESRVTLVDALKRVRSAWTLPKYTLGSEAPGTPRSVFDAGKYAGPSHTAYKDALCLRDVVQNSVLQLSEAMGELEFLLMDKTCAEADDASSWQVVKQKHRKVLQMNDEKRDMSADRPRDKDIAAWVEQPRWWSLKNQGRLTEDKPTRREFKKGTRQLMGEDWSQRHGAALNRAMNRHAVMQVLARA